jgi:hypothetical protein
MKNSNTTSILLIPASDPRKGTRRAFAIVFSLLLLLPGGLFAGLADDQADLYGRGALLLTPGVSADTSMCYGDSVLLQIILPGVGPFSLVVSDGTTTDTLSGIPVSPVEVYVSPDTTTIYTLISYADATQVYQTVNLSVEVIVHPLPVITMPPHQWGACAISWVFILGATPDHGDWSGNFVYPYGPQLGFAHFAAQQAGAGLHEVFYTWTDPVTGCSNTEGKFIEVFPVPTYQITHSYEICKGDSAFIQISNASAPVSYVWNTTDTTAYLALAPENTFTYKVTITDMQTGCPAWDQVTVAVHPRPVVNLGANREVCVDGSININTSIGFADYIWSTGDTTYYILVDGASIGLNQTEIYNVTVTNHWGCSGSGSIELTAVDCTGMDDPDLKISCKIYPNPSDGIFMMKLHGVHGNATLRILNVTGKLVYTETLTLQGELSKELHIGHLATGIYHLQIHTNNGTLTEKVVIR